jgi:sec-independent protein translocase protein TatB
MEIFGIGTSELIFILLIAIIVLGPKDMQKAGKTVGRWLNRMMKSDGWRAFQRASREIRNLPTNLMREANLEELKEMDRDIRNNIDPRPPQPPVSRPPRPRPPSNNPNPATPEPPAQASRPADENDPETQ